MNIFLVDDDLTFRFILRTIANTTDFARVVGEACNGQEALDILTQKFQSGEDLPDVVFLDINMPVMNGWEFLTEISKVIVNRQDVPPIFVLTSSINSEDHKRAETYLCVKGFYTKPINSTHLEEMRQMLQIH